MPTKNIEKIRNATVYIDGKPINVIQEIKLPEIDTERETFIDKLKKIKKMIKTEIFVFVVKRKIRRR